MNTLDRVLAAGREGPQKAMPPDGYYYDLAVEAWHRYCEQLGGSGPQPSSQLSTVERRDGGVTVRLRNVNGWLRTYRYREGPQ